MGEKVYKIRNKKTGEWLWGTRGITWLSDAGGTPTYRTAEHALKKRRGLLADAKAHEKSAPHVSAEYRTAYDDSEVVEYTLSEPRVVDE